MDPGLTAGDADSIDKGECDDVGDSEVLAPLAFDVDARAPTPRVHGEDAVAAGQDMQLEINVNVGGRESSESSADDSSDEILIGLDFLFSGFLVFG